MLIFLFSLQAAIPSPRKKRSSDGDDSDVVDATTQKITEAQERRRQQKSSGEQHEEAISKVMEVVMDLRKRFDILQAKSAEDRDPSLSAGETKATHSSEPATPTEPVCWHNIFIWINLVLEK